MDNYNTSGDNLGLRVVLFLIFTALKLTHYIGWSWIAITSPLWIPLVMIIFLALIHNIFKQ